MSNRMHIACFLSFCLALSGSAVPEKVITEPENSQTLLSGPEGVEPTAATGPPAVGFSFSPHVFVCQI